MTQAALRMKAARDSGDVDRMRDAIRLNWRLWTIIQADLVEPECTVPLEIRNSMLSLSNFVDKRTIEFLAHPEPEKLDVLIGINRDIGGGLYSGLSQGSTEASPSDATDGLRETEA